MDGMPSVVDLAEVLSQSPHQFDPNRLSVVGRSVSSLGCVPSRYTGATSVYLSKNNLCRIAGIEQFTNVRVLSLAHNCITDLGELSRLRRRTHDVWCNKKDVPDP